jgi:hypothetical protein
MFADAIYLALYQERPFRPFRVHLSNGQVFEVPHMDYAMLPPHRRYLTIESVSGPVARINVDQITHLEDLMKDQPPLETVTGTTERK